MESWPRGSVSRACQPRSNEASRLRDSSLRWSAKSRRNASSKSR
ncbi:hypothetical protein OG788_06425 [Streptomyces sp. NBC_00647]